LIPLKLLQNIEEETVPNSFFETRISLMAIAKDITRKL